MALFEVKVCKIESKEAHPNADRLTIYSVGGYRCISNKLEDGTDRYNVGDLVVYIPEQSIVPEWLLKKMELWNEEKGHGVLGGSNYDRVTCVKLRGVTSTGLLLPCVKGVDFNQQLANEYGWSESTIVVVNDFSEYIKYLVVEEGTDVAELLGITKYEPPVLTTMGGEVFNGGKSIVVEYDVEPIQKYKHLLNEGEMVEITEKIHGMQTRWCFSSDKSYDESYGENGSVFISSKGLGNQGLFFKKNADNDKAYVVKSFLDNDVEKKVKESKLYQEYKDLTIYSETVGMQDLKYGLQNGNISNVVFDIYVGKARQGRFLTPTERQEFCKEVGLAHVPVLYVGPYSYEKVMELTDGKTTFGTNSEQIREGVVVKPFIERWDNEIGRVMVKSVSEIYKLRKNGTEYN